MGVQTSVSDRSTSFLMDVSRDITYDVTQLTSHVFDTDVTALADLVGRRPLLIAFDEIVYVLYGATIRAYLERHLNVFKTVILKAGEANKNFYQVERVCEAAISAGLPRNGVMIGVGGGVVLDIVGMAAALYRRGVDFVRIPTTLLGMIDVAVGIKQAVNFGQRKNVLGTFYPPIGVLNDPTFLQTASRRDLASGVAEMIKIGLIADRVLFCLLEQYLERLIESSFQKPAAAAREILERSQYAMMTQLAPNLYENDLKRAVDFGHSFSPTLELRSDYRLTHGEAVALDMSLSTAIAVQRGICGQSLFDRLIALYETVGLPITDDLCTGPLLMEALVDVKGHRGGELNFPVPAGLGACAFLQHVDANDCRVALNAVMRRAHPSVLAASS
ncbi:MAG: sedoheptulose 7-phosphate cyclase [Candidatus Cybelea sp.]